MEIIDNIIDFDKYCDTCKHRDLKGHFDPCNDCLDNPVNTNSAKPVYYEEDKEKVKEKENKKNEEN